MATSVATGSPLPESGALRGGLDVDADALIEQSRQLAATPLRDRDRPARADAEEPADLRPGSARAVRLRLRQHCSARPARPRCLAVEPLALHGLDLGRRLCPDAHFRPRRARMWRAPFAGRRLFAVDRAARVLRALAPGSHR